MKRWFFITAAVVILAFGIGAAVGGNHDNRGGSEVITTASGETVVVTGNRDGGPFPFPFFFFIPLVLLGWLAFSGRGRNWGNDGPRCGPGGSGPSDQKQHLTDTDRAEQWRAWHESQHANGPHPPAPAS